MTTEGGKIEFIEYHQPDLDEGDYTLTVTQSIEGEQQIWDKQNQIWHKRDISEKFEATLRFSVLGPRFTLDPQVVTSVFPPPGSVGDHSNVLPHIILNRSTLPWERSAIRTKKIPWLVLLLFEEGELPPLRARRKSQRRRFKRLASVS
jgi:hypothetical protein